MLRLSYNSLYELLRAYYIYPHKKNNQLQLSPMTYYYSARCFSVGVLSWPRDSFHSMRCWLCILMSRQLLVSYELSSLLALFSLSAELRSFVKIVLKTFIEFH